MKNLFDLKNKVIVITGGTGVLGSCISSYLASQGAILQIIGRNKEKGEALAQSIRTEGYQADFYQSDVLDKKALSQTKEEIIARNKQIDILINAAGGNMPQATIPPDKTFLDVDPIALQSVMELNFMGTALPTMVFAEEMLKQGKGNIINFSSLSALRPLTRVLGYGAAKAAIINYTKFMATEMAEKYGEHFRVNAIVPGFFITEQNLRLLTNEDGSYTERGKSIIAHTPFKRFGNPEDLLGSIHYLASDASEFVTGTALLVDGGFDSFSI